MGFSEKDHLRVDEIKGMGPLCGMMTILEYMEQSNLRLVGPICINLDNLPLNRHIICIEQYLSII